MPKKDVELLIWTITIDNWSNKISSGNTIGPNVWPISAELENKEIMEI